jgi:transcriptional regulator with XRE-family HTH domain
MCPPRIPKSSSTAFVRALGGAVRAQRLRLKQTCVDLAKRSGLSEAAIVQVEAGDPNLDLLQLVAIAEALEIPARTLLQRAQRRVRWAGDGKATAPGTGRGKKGKGRRRR